MRFEREFESEKESKKKSGLHVRGAAAVVVTAISNSPSLILFLTLRTRREHYPYHSPLCTAHFFLIGTRFIRRRPEKLGRGKIGERI